jgi:dolichol-phosphate mannosyltransferase
MNSQGDHTTGRAGGIRFRTHIHEQDVSENCATVRAATGTGYVRRAGGTVPVPALVDGGTPSPAWCRSPNSLYLSIVVPCYNEAEVLSHCYQRIRSVCESLGQAYELVFVNDGSDDETWDVLRELSDQDGSVVAVNLSRNFGQQSALTAGLSCSRGAHVAILDADLQDPPELLPEMLALLKQERADVVFGRRRTRAGETWFKRLTAATFYRLLNLVAETSIPRDTGDFRVLTRRVVDVVLLCQEHSRFMRGLMMWVGFRQVPLVYDRQRRQAGTTKWPTARMAGLALDALTGFSIKPLRAAAWFALTLILISAGAATAALTMLTDLPTSVVVITTSAVSTALLGQVGLVSVLAEYVARIHVESRHRPLFVVSDILNKSVVSRAGGNQEVTYEQATT